MKDRVIQGCVAFTSIGLIAIGALAIATPETAARMFGIPIHSIETRAYVWATATRDIAVGCWLLALVALRVPRVSLGASMLAVALIPIGDFINVYSNSNASPLSLFLHGVSALAFLAFGSWLCRAHGSR